MKNKILVVIPTRGRGDKIHESIDAFRETVTGYADLCIALDEDDQHNYDIPKLESFGCIVEVNPRKRMIGTLNIVAKKYASEYRMIGFIGDDHRFRTKAWDSIILGEADIRGVLIAYGNDLLMKEELPTAAFVTSNIISRLGFMVPEFLIHFFADNFWKDIGNATGTLKYYEHLIIEHMHFSAGKSEKDEMYNSTNNDQIFVPDRDNYADYMAGDFSRHIEAIKQLVAEYDSN